MFQKVKGYNAEKQKFVFGSSFKRSKGVNYVGVGNGWCPVDSLLFSTGYKLSDKQELYEHDVVQDLNGVYEVIYYPEDAAFKLKSLNHYEGTVGLFALNITSARIIGNTQAPEAKSKQE